MNTIGCPACKQPIRPEITHECTAPAAVSAEARQELFDALARMDGYSIVLPLSMEMHVVSATVRVDEDHVPDATAALREMAARGEIELVEDPDDEE
jgi:hypothetical protein